MSLVLLHPWIAALGVGAIAIPIAIHLLLRQRPRVVSLPSLMFLRKSQVQTIRQLRIRHWILLACRAFLLALLALALARPTLKSSLLSIDQEAPLAVAFVIDTSASMSLVERGKTRIEEARLQASEAARRLPRGSKILLIESSQPVAGPALDVASSLARIEAIEGRRDAMSLGDAIRSALDGLARMTEARRELYVFSDQTATAWNLGEGSRLGDAVQSASQEVTVFVVDVSAQDRDNVSLAEWRLPGDVLSTVVEPEIEVVVRNSGIDVDNVVRLVLDGEPRAEKPVRLARGHSVSLRFPLGSLSEGPHQGELKLAGADAFVADDRRYFSFAIRPLGRQLVVADSRADALYWSKALAAAGGEASLEQATPADLAQVDLDSFRAVSLLNVARLDQANWSRLAAFVGRGGGIFVALGPNVDPNSYNSATAQQILPARLVDIATPPKAFLALGNESHPVALRLRRFPELDLGDWAIHKFWRIEPSAEGSARILNYSTGEVAMIERTFGDTHPGRTILFTTAAHYQPEGDAWNEWPLGWSYLVLAEEMARYLGGDSEERLQFLVGESAAVQRRPGDAFAVYAVTGPDQVVERISVDPREPVVRIPDVRLEGQYRWDASDAGRSATGGFSVNIAPEESQLDPLPAEQIQALFAPAPISVVRDADELKRVEGSARVGRELFPWLALLAALFFVGESFLSNRFYRTARQPGT